MIYTDGVHLVSDFHLNELHHFARKMGLKRCWFQGGRHPHYDLTTARKSVLADRMGARRVSTREIIDALRVLQAWREARRNRPRLR